jgi:hypothetical protein
MLADANQRYGGGVSPGARGGLRYSVLNLNQILGYFVNGHFVAYV